MPRHQEILDSHAEKRFNEMFPALYKNVLVVNGAFHSHAHFLMAVHFLWWECFLGVLLMLLPVGACRFDVPAVDV